MFMKKISLLTLAVCAGFAVFAQDEPTLKTQMSVKPRFGLKAGVNLATLEIDDDNNSSGAMNTNMKTSFNGGVFANIPMGGMFRFQPEIVYSGQGTKGSQGSNNFEYDFHYVNVPLMVQLQTTGGFFVEAGPQFGFLVKAKLDNETGNDVDLKDNNSVKRTDIAAGVGLGYISRVGLGVTAKYVHGFSNVWNNEDSPLPVNYDFSNRVIGFSIVYLLGANK